MESIRTSRCKFLEITKADNYQNTATQLSRLFGSYLYSKLSDSDRKSMKYEVESYYQNGFAFVEELLNLPVPAATYTSANSTFFEAADGTYNLHGNSFPYRCFFHSFKFSSESLKKLGYSGFSLTIKDENFSQQPLLANSIQQFAIWITSCGALFSNVNSYNVLFTFQCSDAVEFCHLLCDCRLQVFTIPLPCLFDAIYTSNLIDYIACPSLVLAAMSVLKKSGILFTDAFRHILVSNTSSGFIKALFDFESKYLPLICGVRCIGNDDEYSDELSIKPVPYTTEFDILHSVTTKSLVWQHVTGTPLKRVTTEHFSSMMRVLCDSIYHMLTSCIRNDSGSIMKSLLCATTVIQLLKSFVSQLDTEECDYTKYEFWSSLCCMLLNQKGFQAFMVSLQTHALLHGFHLHLTVSEFSCPLCNKTSIHEVFTQYSIALENRPGTDLGICEYEYRISILVHNVSPVDTVVMKTWKEIITANDFHVHVVDSMAGTETNGKTQLNFFSPVSFLQNNYHVSIILSYYKAVNTVDSVVLMHTHLSNCKSTENNYLFSQCIRSQPDPVCSTFGKVIQHSGSVDHFESVIVLSDQSMSALEHSKIITDKITAAKIKFIIKNFLIEISYPYPVDYKTMSIKLSRKNKNVIVVAHRKQHQLYEEEPIYIVNPDNTLTLPTMFSVKKDDIQLFSDMQFKKDESYKMYVAKRIPRYMSPEINLKETWNTILQECNANFFRVVYGDSPMNVMQLYQNAQCFLVIQNRNFDLQNRTPSIDLYFCFLTPERCKTIYDKWVSAYKNDSETTKSDMRDIIIDENECWLLQNMLNYFVHRTVSTLKNTRSARHRLLVKYKISQHFTRAVVYPLYPNTNVKGLEICKPFDLSSLSISTCTPVPDQKKCSLCGKYSEDLKKCSRCRLTQYCNRECQKKHWGTHKNACCPQKPATDI